MSKITSNRLSSIYVLDQDQALDFYYGRDMGIRDPFGNNLRIGTITG